MSNRLGLDGITISYHPFDYAPIPDSEAARLGADPANTFPEKNPYKVHETLYYGDGTSEPRVATLPLIYVVWPYDGRIVPDSIEHKIDYDVFIPRHDSRISKNGFSEEALSILHKEIQKLAKSAE